MPVFCPLRLEIAAVIGAAVAAVVVGPVIVVAVIRTVVLESARFATILPIALLTIASALIAVLVLTLIVIIARRPVIKSWLVEPTWLRLLTSSYRLNTAFTAEIITIVVGKFAVDRRIARLPAHRPRARRILEPLLLAVGHDNAIIVFCVLKIIFG